MKRRSESSMRPRRLRGDGAKQEQSVLGGGGDGSQSSKGIRTRLSTGTLVMSGTSTTSPFESSSVDRPVSPSTSSSAGDDAASSVRQAGRKDTALTPSRKRKAAEESEVDGPPAVPPKRKKIGRNDGSGEDNKNDYFCWLCHKEGLVICCELCPRVFHAKCLNIENNVPQDWVCPECEKIMKAECTDTRSKAMSMISVDLLCTLLRYALDRMRTVGAEPFENPVDPAIFPNYSDYVFYPMSLSVLQKNIRRKEYGSTEAFLADTKWIYHNSCVYNGIPNRITSVARALLKVCKHEMSEIEVCPDCYYNSCVQSDIDWFCEPCRTPHPLVWAKLKGYPFWPAKALREVKGQIDVRFFGAHDRSWVPVASCFMLSKNCPVQLKKGRGGMDGAMREVEIHVKKLREKLGSFDYAPFRTPYSSDSVYCKMKNINTGSGSGGSKQAGKAKMKSKPGTSEGRPTEKQSVAGKAALALKSKYSNITLKKGSVSTPGTQQRQVIYLKPMPKGVFLLSEQRVEPLPELRSTKGVLPRPTLPDLQLIQRISDKIQPVTSSSSSTSETDKPDEAASCVAGKDCETSAQRDTRDVSVETMETSDTVKIGEKSTSASEKGKTLSENISSSGKDISGRKSSSSDDSKVDDKDAEDKEKNSGEAAEQTGAIIAAEVCAGGSSGEANLGSQGECDIQNTADNLDKGQGKSVVNQSCSAQREEASKERDVVSPASSSRNEKRSSSESASVNEEESSSVSLTSTDLSDTSITLSSQSPVKSIETSHKRVSESDSSRHKPVAGKSPETVEDGNKTDDISSGDVASRSVKAKTATDSPKGGDEASSTPCQGHGNISASGADRLAHSKTAQSVQPERAISVGGSGDVAGPMATTTTTSTSLSSSTSASSSTSISLSVTTSALAMPPVTSASTVSPGSKYKESLQKVIDSCKAQLGLQGDDTFDNDDDAFILAGADDDGDDGCGDEPDDDSDALLMDIDDEQEDQLADTTSPKGTAQSYTPLSSQITLPVVNAGDVTQSKPSASSLETETLTLPMPKTNESENMIQASSTQLPALGTEKDAPLVTISSDSSLSVDEGLSLTEDTDGKKEGSSDSESMPAPSSSTGKTVTLSTGGLVSKSGSDSEIVVIDDDKDDTTKEKDKAAEAKTASEDQEVSPIISIHDDDDDDVDDEDDEESNNGDNVTLDMEVVCADGPEEDSDEEVMDEEVEVNETTEKSGSDIVVAATGDGDEGKSSATDTDKSVENTPTSSTSYPTLRGTLTTPDLAIVQTSMATPGPQITSEILPSAPTTTSVGSQLSQALSFKTILSTSVNKNLPGTKTSALSSVPPQPAVSSGKEKHISPPHKYRFKPRILSSSRSKKSSSSDNFVIMLDDVEDNMEGEDENNRVGQMNDSEVDDWDNDDSEVEGVEEVRAGPGRIGCSGGSESIDLTGHVERQRNSSHSSTTRDSTVVSEDSSSGLNSRMRAVVKDRSAKIEKLILEQLEHMAKDIQKMTTPVKDIQKMTTPAAASSVESLRTEMETQKKRYEKKIQDLWKTMASSLKESLNNYKLQKDSLAQQLRKEFKSEMEVAVAETKKHQWCAECWKEAVYYCCWNTSYCSYQCQQKHWPSHMPKCMQTQQLGTAAQAGLQTHQQQAAAPQAVSQVLPSIAQIPTIISTLTAASGGSNNNSSTSSGSITSINSSTVASSVLTAPSQPTAAVTPMTKSKIVRAPTVSIVSPSQWKANEEAAKTKKMFNLIPPQPSNSNNMNRGAQDTPWQPAQPAFTPTPQRHSGTPSGGMQLFNSGQNIQVSAASNTLFAPAQLQIQYLQQPGTAGSLPQQVQVMGPSSSSLPIIMPSTIMTPGQSSVQLLPGASMFPLVQRPQQQGIQQAAAQHPQPQHFGGNRYIIPGSAYGNIMRPGGPM